MSGAQTSTFPTMNELLAPMAAYDTHQNQLMYQQQRQQEISANEMEQASRAANWVLTQDDKPAAYSTALRLLKANGYAKNSPEQYPGDAAISYLARQGTPSKDLYQQTQDSAWANANKIGGGGAPGATAPPADGGGGFSSDKETARKQIVARESGGNPTVLNYVAQQDPTAYARGATASGKYQFVNSTWREGLQLAGIDPAKYATARDAPEAVQDQVFDAVYAKYGTKPWEKGPRDWVKDEQGRYQLATVRPPPGSPGGAPVTAAAAPPGGGTTPPPYRVAQAGPLTTPPPAATTAQPAASPAPVTTIEPETGLPMLSGPPNQVMPGQPNGPPARPAVPMRETFVRGPDGSVQKALVPVDGSGPPVIVPPPTAPAATPPAATPPAATAPPPPPPPAAPQQPPFSRPAPVNPATGLRRDQEQELNGLLPMASRSREGQAQWVARKQQMIQQNQADQRQYETQVNTWQNQQGEAADRAERIRLSQATGQREEAARAEAADKARREREAAADPIQGKDVKANADRTLFRLKAKMEDGTVTPEERALYAEAAQYYLKPQMQWISDPSDPTKSIMVPVAGQLPYGFPHPSFQPGQPPAETKPPSATKTDFKPLPEAERKLLLDTSTKLDQLVEQRSTFKPDFGGFLTAAMGDAANAVARNNPIASKADTARADWWQNYQRVKLAVRQGISGQSLTASELAEFDKADINPGMSPDRIIANLAHQDRVLRTAHERRVRSLAADRYSPDAIREAAGIDPATAAEHPSGAVLTPPPTAPLPPGFKVIVP